MPDKFQVFDEMANAVILETEDKRTAVDTAYNYQCVLLRNGEVIRDYSC